MILLDIIEQTIENPRQLWIRGNNTFNFSGILILRFNRKRPQKILEVFWVWQVLLMKINVLLMY